MRRVNEDNPFCNAGGAINEAEDFVGRKCLLRRQVRQSVGASASQLYSCWGLPRIGKTSFMLRVMSECESGSCGRCLVLYRDVSNFIKPGCAAELWWGLGRELATRIGVASNQESPQSSMQAGIEFFLEMLGSAKSNGKFVLLVLDEFCTCLKMQTDECDDFINNFRSLFGGGLAARDLVGVLRCRVVSRRNPDYIQSQTGGSTLNGVFGANVVQLLPFNRAEFDEQCGRLPKKLSAKDADSLWNKTGGHPYLTALILQEYREQEIEGGRPVIEEVVAGRWSIIEAYFKDIEKLFDEIGDSAEASALRDVGLYNDFLRQKRESASGSLNDDNKGLKKTGIVVDLYDSSVRVGEMELVRLSPGALAIFILAANNVDKDIWVETLEDLSYEKWKNAPSWFGNIFGVHGYKKQEWDEQDRGKRLLNLRNKHMSEIRKKIENKLPEGCRIVPKGNDPPNFELDEIKWCYKSESQNGFPPDGAQMPEKIENLFRGL